MLEGASMKSIVLAAYGNVDQLELRDSPQPPLGPNSIDVRMAGASINPIDWKLRSGALAEQMPLKLPTVLGKDASGVVAAVAPGVTGFEVGMRVMGLIDGGYAEHVVAAMLLALERLQVAEVLLAARSPLRRDEVFFADDVDGRAFELDVDTAREGLLELDAGNCSQEIDPSRWHAEEEELVRTE